VQIYYINLARRTDRRSFMEEQFDRFGLMATRVEAVTADEVPPADRDAYCHPSRPFWLSTKECACTLSHLNVMRALLDSADALALVLEDDVALSPRLPAFLAAIEAAPPDFDLLRIETGDTRVRVLSVQPALAGIEIVRLVGYDSGSGGYLVSRRGAERLLKSVEARRRPVDQAWFDSQAPLARQLVVRQTVPGLCIQSRFEVAGVPLLESDLGNGDTRPAAEAPWVWRHRLNRFSRALHRDTITAFRKQWFQRVEGARLLRIPFLATR
jgi:glycosyl transferase family 25